MPDAMPAFLDQPLRPRMAIGQNFRPADIPDPTLGAAIRAWWPSLDTRTMATVLVIPEARVANMLARIRDEARA